jgi:cobalt/nickel transport system permease protein/cobalt/nickel transport protein
MSRNRGFLYVGVVVALFLAGVVSWFASSSPDGLEKVAGDTGFLDKATGHASDGSPFAGYETSFVGGRLGQTIAGVAGVALTLAIAYALTWYVRRKGGGSNASPTDATTGDTPSVQQGGNAVRRG